MSKKEILQKIKEENVKPTPKWHFIFKSYFVWIAFGLSIIIGSLATSVAVHIIATNDLSIAPRLGRPKALHLLETLPYIWITIFAIFIALAYFNLKHTEKGYRLRLPIIILINLISSLILGLALFGLGTANRIENFAIEKIPAYKTLIENQMTRRWQQEEAGLLIGEVTSISDNQIQITDFKGNEWDIQISSQIPPISEGEIIHIIGEKTSENSFEAERIMKNQRGIRPPQRPNRPPLQNDERFLKENPRPPRSS